MKAMFTIKQPNPQKITFAIATMSRCGGPRVTVEMANMLLDRGHDVNITCEKRRVTPKTVLNTFFLKMTGKYYHPWDNCFKRKIMYCKTFQSVNFGTDVKVIAVGTGATAKMKDIKTEAVRIRYCHGFDSSNQIHTEQAWSGPMPTIAVAHTLVPHLEAYSNQKVAAVIPNGVRSDQYFQENLERDGIGLVYDLHPNKAPETAAEVLKSIKSKWPGIPQYVFGGARRPSFLSNKSYWQYPSIDKARELYNRAKVWLVVSRMEGFGLPALEAMACGAAVISTDNLGCREFIKDGENGFLVPIGNTQAFMDRIELLLSDEPTRLKLTQEGFKTVKKYTWSNAVEKMENFLYSLKRIPEETPDNTGKRTPLCSE